MATTADTGLGGRRLASVALPVVFVATATVLRLAIGPIVAQRPFLLLGGAVVASAWYGGALSGMVAILCSVAAAAYFLPPTGFVVASPDDLAALALFVAEMALVTAVFQQAREAVARAQEAAERVRSESAERREAELMTRQMESGLAALTRLGTALVSELQPGEVALLAVQGAASVTAAPWSALSFAFGREGAALRQGTGAVDVVSALLPDAAAARAAAGERGVRRADDARLEPELAALFTQRLPARSLLLARLDGRSGTGVLVLAHPQRGFFDARHERLVAVIALQAASALDNAYHHADAQRAIAEAQVAGRVKDEFLSTLSHELRTPLNAILGWAHLLRGRQLGPDDTRRAVETIVRNATLQEDMIRGLLDMSSLLNGRLRLQVAPVDLRAVVEEAVATARPYARAKTIDLQLAAPGAPVPVLADGVRLQQVVWSLLSNAVKFTPAGGSVRVSVAPGEASAEVVVADSGSGMDREFLSRVFSRFTRADASSTRPTRGLGLALAVARGLVELHDGELTADSPGPGRGSTFTVRLPLPPHAPAEAFSFAPQVVATSPLRVPVAPGPRPGSVA